MGTWSIVCDSMGKHLMTEMKIREVKVNVYSYERLTPSGLKTKIKAGERFDGKQVILMLGTCVTDQHTAKKFWRDMEQVSYIIKSTHPFCEEVYAVELLPRTYNLKSYYMYNKEPTKLKRMRAAYAFVEKADGTFVAKRHLFAKDGLHLSSAGNKKLAQLLMGFISNQIRGKDSAKRQRKRRRGKR